MHMPCAMWAYRRTAPPPTADCPAGMAVLAVAHHSLRRRTSLALTAALAALQAPRFTSGTSGTSSTSGTSGDGGGGPAGRSACTGAGPSAAAGSTELSCNATAAGDELLLSRVRVEVVADVVCPWCYIGHSRLQAASRMAAEMGIVVEPVFTPFILRRHLPKAGIDKTKMFAQQFGSIASVRQKYAGITRAAVADGLCFDPEGQLAGNSEDAHRLLLWANDRTQPHQGRHFEALLEELFLVYNCACQQLQQTLPVLRGTGTTI
jgi:hypothetical protein